MQVDAFDRGTGDATISFDVAKGNLDPVSHIMQATPDQCRERAHECISIAQGYKYMLSAGCEIPAETPDAVFQAFCDAPKTFPQ